MERAIKLPERLMVIAGYIEKDAAVADIGTDHGFLPAYLAQNKLARRIIASDISAGSLDSARRTAEKFGVTKMISFAVAPGLEGLDEKTADTVVIAGVGGETIAGILRDAPWTREHGVSLILQPQSKTGELCLWLRKSGYIIRNAKLAFDSGRIYVIMLIRGGDSDSELEPELELLTRLMYNRDPLFKSYLDELIIRTRSVLDDMKNSGTPDLLDIALRLSVYLSLKEVDEKWQA